MSNYLKKLGRQTQEKPRDKAGAFYMIAKSRIGATGISSIFPLNLPKLTRLESDEFSNGITALAEHDGLKALIYRHEELSDDDKKGLPRMLKLSHEDSIRKEATKNKILANRIYMQLISVA
jgi:hypothetical protein